VIADDAYITESIMDPLARIHDGYEPVMPSFLGRMRPAEVAAILEYIRSLRGVVPQPGARTPSPEGPPFLRSGPPRPAPASGDEAVGPIEGGRRAPALNGLETPMRGPARGLRGRPEDESR
jgi:cytochrome c oxidase subunit 2